MQRPYGFSVKVGDSGHECLFTSREWRILNDSSGFNTVRGLTRLIGLDALGRQIGVKKYEVELVRQNAYFVGQLEWIIRVAATDEVLLRTDYRTYIKGLGQQPELNRHCTYLGHWAVIRGGPAHCTLRWSKEVDGNRIEVGVIDLRRESKYDLGDGYVARIRRNRKPCEIHRVLSELKEFCDGFDDGAPLTIRLVGGDS